MGEITRVDGQVLRRELSTFLGQLSTRFPHFLASFPHFSGVSHILQTFTYFHIHIFSYIHKL